MSPFSDCDKPDSVILNIFLYLLDQILPATLVGNYFPFSTVVLHGSASHALSPAWMSSSPCMCFGSCAGPQSPHGSLLVHCAGPCTVLKPLSSGTLLKAALPPQYRPFFMLLGLWHLMLNCPFIWRTFSLYLHSDVLLWAALPCQCPLHSV